MECNKCGTKLIVREFVSMGTGYDEWESHSDGEIIIKCPKCRTEATPEQYKAYFEWGPRLTQWQAEHI